MPGISETCDYCGEPASSEKGRLWAYEDKDHDYRMHAGCWAQFRRGRGAVLKVLDVGYAGGYYSVTVSDAAGGRSRGRSTSVVYVMEGNLHDRGWVPYGTLGPVSEDQAMGVLREWQESRDMAGYEIRYRLLRRTVTDEVVAEESLTELGLTQANPPYYACLIRSSQGGKRDGKR